MTVIELPRTERGKIDVVVAYTHAAGERLGVSPDESFCVFIHHLEINGHWFWPEVAKLKAEGFLELELSAIDYEPEEYRGKHLQAIALLKATLTPSDWLEGTTHDVLRLPVSRIQWVEYQHE